VPKRIVLAPLACTIMPLITRVTKARSGHMRISKA